jgi:hypothetical protein
MSRECHCALWADLLNSFNKFNPKGMIMKTRWGVCSFFTLSLVLSGCETKEDLPDIGKSIAGPTDVETSTDEKYFYVLNSDFERQFGEGSILVITPEGDKVDAVTTPRMGRSMEIVDDLMLITFGEEEVGGKGAVQLYDLTDPAKPVLKKTFELECAPLNVVARSSYQYFAVVCSDGDIYMGTLAAELGESTLTRARSYGYRRRALYLDSARGLLLAFPTDLALQNERDTKYEDITGYDANHDLQEEENEVPDQLEKTRRLRTVRSTWRGYQYTVYDINAEAPNFAYKSIGDDDEKESVEAEHRWLYFTLANLDGTPDSDEGSLDTTIKHYRTNFWAAKEDPFSDGSFYLSHRGFNESVNANNIIRVDIVGDLRPTEVAADADCASTSLKVGSYCVPKTSSALSFTRSYGFVADKLHYPGDFDIKYVQGQPLLAVNHFRDPIFFKKEERNFSVAATILGEGTWISELRTTSFSNSYYQIAVNSAGQAVTCSFYGDAVLMLNMTPGQDIEIVKKVQ